jgi:hypothetical protein
MLALNTRDCADRPVSFTAQYQANSKPRDSYFVNMTQAGVSAPMHSFRLRWKISQYVGVTSHFHADFSRLSKPAKPHGFEPAFITQSVAVPAREKCTASKEDLCNSAPAAGAAKPRPMTAEMAGRPRDRHALVDGLPFFSFPVASAKTQDNRAWFSAHANAAALPGL